MERKIAFFLSLSILITLTNPLAIEAVNSTVFNSQKNLWAWQSGGYVILMWESEANAQYNIFRRSPTTEWVRLNEKPFFGARHIDIVGNSSDGLEYSVESIINGETVLYPPVFVPNEGNKHALQKNSNSSAVEELQGVGSNEHNKNNIINDGKFLNSGSMSVNDIQRFLEGQNSFLASYSTTDIEGTTRTAAEIIYNASQNYYGYPLNPYKVNPQIVLTTLQKEQVLITTPPGQATDSQLRWAMGYLDERHQGFARQVDAATWQFRKNWQDIVNNGNKNGWGVGIRTRSCDFVDVTPQNTATADLYAYTPNVGAQWGGVYPDCNGEGGVGVVFGGNYLYWDIFYNVFQFGGSSNLQPLALIGQPAPGGGTFASFATYYDMNNRGDVIFAAEVDLTGDGQGDGSETFKFSNGEFSKVTVPGITTVGAVRINDSGDMAFGYLNAPGRTQAVYFLKAGTSTSVKIAEWGNPSPISGRTYYDLRGPLAMSENGKVTFQSSLYQSSTNTVFCCHLFLYSSSTNSVIKVVGDGDPTPMGASFDLAPVNVNHITSDGDVVFWARVNGGAASDGIFRFSPATLGISKVVTQGDPAPAPMGGTLSSPSMRSGAVSGRRLVFQSFVIGGTAEDAIFVKDDVRSNTPLRVIAYAGQLTGTEVGGRFSQPGNPSSSNWPFFSNAPQVRADGGVVFFSYLVLQL